MVALEDVLEQLIGDVRDAAVTSPCPRRRGPGPEGADRAGEDDSVDSPSPRT